MKKLFAIFSLAVLVAAGSMPAMSVAATSAKAPSVGVSKACGSCSTSATGCGTCGVAGKTNGSVAGAASCGSCGNSAGCGSCSASSCGGSGSGCGTCGEAGKTTSVKSQPKAKVTLVSNTTTKSTVGTPTPSKLAAAGGCGSSCGSATAGSAKASSACGGSGCGGVSSAVSPSQGGCNGGCGSASKGATAQGVAEPGIVLTDEQKQELSQVNAKYGPRLTELNRKYQGLRTELAKLSADPNADADSIGKKVREVADAQAELQLASILASREKNAIYTAEQKAMLARKVSASNSKALQSGGCGGGCGSVSSKVSVAGSDQ